MKTRNEETANTTKSERMWFGWSIITWEAIFFWVTAAAAVFGAVGIFSAFSSAIIGYKISDVVTREASIKIADATARQKEAELKLQTLRDNVLKQTFPRRASEAEFLKELEDTPPSSVEVLYDRGSPDAYFLADQIWGFLFSAKWMVEPTTGVAPLKPPPPNIFPWANMPLTMAVGGGPWGISLIANRRPRDNDPQDPLNALRDAIFKSGAEGSMTIGIDANLPDGKYRIVVGPRAPFWTGPPEDLAPAQADPPPAQAHK